MEQLTPLLEKLASQLGTTVEQLWKVLLQQTQVEILLCNLWMGIWLWGGISLIVIAIIIFIISAIKDFDAAAAWGVFIFFATIIIAGIGYYVNYSEWVTLTTNPEYWALKEVLSVLGK